MKLTLAEAIRDNRLADFIDDAEASNDGQADCPEFERRLERLIKAPQPEGRTSRSRARDGSRDVTPVFHPAAARDRPVLSRMSAGEATGGFKPTRCCSSSAANAAGVA